MVIEYGDWILSMGMDMEIGHWILDIGHEHGHHNDIGQLIYTLHTEHEQ